MLRADIDPCGLPAQQQIKHVWGTLQLAAGSRNCVLGTNSVVLEGKLSKCP